MSKNISKVWTFSSDSNPNKSYETLLYNDGTASCNCPGWTRRVDVNGQRSCKHTRLVDQGVAGQHCKSSFDYMSGGKVEDRVGQMQRGKKSVDDTMAVKGKRRIILEA